MAFIDGYLIRVRLGGVAFTCSTSNRVSLNRQGDKIVCDDNYPAGFIVDGPLEGQFTVEGFLDDAAANGGRQAAQAIITGGQEAVVALDVGGGFSIVATACKFSNVELGGSTEELGDFTATLEIGGDVSIV